MESVYVAADSVNVANDVVAGRERKLRRGRIQAAAHEDISEGDARSDYLYAHLAGPGTRQLVLYPLKNFRASKSGNQDVSVFL
jgi:hypothetical protein